MVYFLGIIKSFPIDLSRGGTVKVQSPKVTRLVLVMLCIELLIRTDFDLRVHQ